MNSISRNRYTILVVRRHLKWFSKVEELGTFTWYKANMIADQARKEEGVLEVLIVIKMVKYFGPSEVHVHAIVGQEEVANLSI